MLLKCQVFFKCRCSSSDVLQVSDDFFKVSDVLEVPDVLEVMPFKCADVLEVPDVLQVMFFKCQMFFKRTVPPPS